VVGLTLTKDPLGRMALLGRGLLVLGQDLVDPWQERPQPGAGPRSLGLVTGRDALDDHFLDGLAMQARLAGNGLKVHPAYADVIFHALHSLSSGPIESQGARPDAT
jgi:hypothetical protein